MIIIKHFTWFPFLTAILFNLALFLAQKVRISRKLFLLILIQSTRKMFNNCIEIDSNFYLECGVIPCNKRLGAEQQRAESVSDFFFELCINEVYCCCGFSLGDLKKSLNPFRRRNGKVGIFFRRLFIIKSFFFQSNYHQALSQHVNYKWKIKEMLPSVRYKKLNFDSFSSFTTLALPTTSRSQKNWNKKKYWMEKPLTSV